tara:strand:+ start:796 stop:1284 length:489 start_codon:yes stop_codon:yes gene_type:complete
MKVKLIPTSTMAKLITEFTNEEMFAEMKRRGLVEGESDDESDDEEEEVKPEVYEDNHKCDYTDEVEEEPIEKAYIDYETYKEYFAEFYLQEKEHDDETYFHLELYKKKNWKPKEMSAWSEMYFKIEPDGETNKTFERVKYIEYNTSSCFAMMLSGLDFDDEF